MQRRDTSVLASDGNVKRGSRTSLASERNDQTDHLASSTTSDEWYKWYYKWYYTTKKLKVWNRHKQMIADQLKHRRNVNNVTHSLTKNLPDRSRGCVSWMSKSRDPWPSWSIANGTVQISPSLNKTDSKTVARSTALTPETRMSREKRKESTPASRKRRRRKGENSAAARRRLKARINLSKTEFLTRRKCEKTWGRRRSNPRSNGQQQRSYPTRW